MDKSVVIGHLEKADSEGGEFQSLGALEWTNFQEQGFPRVVLPSSLPLHASPTFHLGR